MKIILFEDERMGGQRTLTLNILEYLLKINKDTYAYLSVAPQLALEKKLNKNIRYYDYVKSISRRSKEVKELTDRIHMEQPEWIWFIQDNILERQISLNLYSKTRVSVSIHDVIPHENRYAGLYYKIRNYYSGYLLKKSMECCADIVLYSEESKKDFEHLYPKFEKKVLCITLGAILPETEHKPPEIPVKLGRFILFFGRIDEYKGLGGFLRIYAGIQDDKLPFVVAGSGILSGEEQKICDEEDSVLLINRFITDEEMRWLLHHASATVLPYISATQSGPLVCSYACGTGVIVSSHKNLTQFVVDGVTGFICKTEADYIHAIKSFQDEKTEKKMGKNAQLYYAEEQDWGKNLEKLYHTISGG